MDSFQKPFPEKQSIKVPAGFEEVLWDPDTDPDAEEDTSPGQSNATYSRPRATGSMATLPKISAAFANTAMLRNDGNGASGNSGIVSSMKSTAFLLGNVIGKGGMGEILQAEQTSLRRIVAVKRPLIDSQMPRDQAEIFLDMFAREAAVTARLDHPNIVPIHDLGIGPDEQPLMAMKLVRGTPWPDLLQADRDLPTYQRLAKHLNILTGVAQAVAFAHERGVIHRDIKPAQVMVGRHGEVYLMDWGLAVAFSGPGESEISLAEAGALAPLTLAEASNPAGTPCYMAPEQTDRNTERLGPWTDIWLLGALLYEILTGTPPYQYPHPMKAMRAASAGMVESPEVRVGVESTEAGAIPPELSAICMACLRPGIDARIPSADQFVQLLMDYQSGASRREESRQLSSGAVQNLEALEATGKHADYEALEDCDRRLSRSIGLDPENAEAVVGKQHAVAALAQAALRRGDLHLARVQAGRISDATKRAPILDGIVEAEARAMRLARQRIIGIATSVVLVIIVAIVALVSRSKVSTALGKAQVSERVARSAEGEAQARRQQAEALLYASNAKLVGNYLESGAFDLARTALWQMPEERRNWEWGYYLRHCWLDVMTFKGNFRELDAAHFTPDGKSVVLSYASGYGERRNALTGEPTRVFTRGGMFLNGLTRNIVTPTVKVAFNPASNRMLSILQDNAVRISHVETGAVVSTLPSHGTTISFTQFSTDGSRLLTLTEDRVARVWDVASGAQLVSSNEPLEGFAARIDTGGDHLVLATANNSLKLMKIASQRNMGSISGHSGRITFVAFAPTGKYMASCSEDNTARVWDLETSQLAATLSGHSGAVSAAAFSPDGSMVITAARDRSLRVWEAGTGRVLRTIATRTLVPESVQFNPAGNHALVVSDREAPELYDVSTGAEVTTFRGHSGPVVSAMFSPDGLQLLTASKDATAKIWDAKRAAAFNVIEYPTSFITHAFFTADGKSIVTMTKTGAVKVTSAVRHELLGDLQVGTAAVTLAASPDGSQVAVADTMGRIEIWDTKTRHQIRMINIPATSRGVRVLDLSYDPAGKRLMVCLPKQVSIVDLAKQETLIDIKPAGTGQFSRSWLSASGSKVVTIYNSGAIAKWDAITGKQVVEQAAGGKGHQFLASTSEDTRFAWNCPDHTVQITTLGSTTPVTLVGHSRPVFACAFSPDSSRVITESRDNTVKVWDVSSGLEISSLENTFTSNEAFPERGEGRALAFSPDGTRLLVRNARSSLAILEAAPFRKELLPGESSMSWNDRFNLHRSQEYQKWLANPRVVASATGDADSPTAVDAGAVAERKFEFFVESRPEGQNYANYREMYGKWLDSSSPMSSTKSTAAGLTPANTCGSRKAMIVSRENATAGAAARFMAPKLEVPTKLRVEVTWPTAANIHPVTYTVKHGEVVDKRVMTQDGWRASVENSGANQWVLLGEFEFTNATDQYVEVSVPPTAVAADPRNPVQVYADAVRFSIPKGAK